jgi:MFS transporter, MCT family, solute carrier family 16 (monocarboxylic acid transporters), member 10
VNDAIIIILNNNFCSLAALVGSLAIGTMFFLSPVAGILTDTLGLRRTTLLGGALAAGGMLLSSFFCDSVTTLLFTYGIMYGLGAALSYTPSLAILGHYFSKYLGLVNGVVTAGSSVFTVIMPVVLEYFLETSGLVVTLRVLALLSSFVMVCAIIFKPISQPKQKIRTDKSSCGSIKSFVLADNWKIRKYVIWALAIPLALFGYFVPYVHMATFVKHKFGVQSNLPVMCIGITSGLGRLIFGYVADSPKVNRILLQQISFYSIGLLSICLPFATHYYMLLVISLGMGLFDGCFITLLGPIAFDICGQKGGTQAIGFLLGFCSIPLTIGPPVAGMIYDHTQSYTLPLVMAGIPPLIGATVMFLITFTKNKLPEENHSNGHVVSNAWQNGEFFLHIFL